MQIKELAERTKLRQLHRLGLTFPSDDVKGKNCVCHLIAVREDKLELLPYVAPFENETISVALDGYLEEEGFRIVTSFQTGQVQKREGRFLLSGTQDGTELTFAPGNCWWPPAAAPARIVRHRQR